MAFLPKPASWRLGRTVALPLLLHLPCDGVGGVERQRCDCQCGTCRAASGKHGRAGNEQIRMVVCAAERVDHGGASFAPHS